MKRKNRLIICLLVTIITVLFSGCVNDPGMDHSTVGKTEESKSVSAEEPEKGSENPESETGKSGEQTYKSSEEEIISDKTDNGEKKPGFVSVRVLDKTDSYSKTFSDVYNVFFYDENGMLIERQLQMKGESYLFQSFVFTYDDRSLITTLKAESRDKYGNTIPGELVFYYDDEGMLTSYEEDTKATAEQIKKNGLKLDIPDKIVSNFSNYLNENGESVLRKDSTDIFGNENKTEFVFNSNGVIREMRTNSTEYSLYEKYSYDNKGNVISGKVSDGTETAVEFEFKNEYLTDGNLDRRTTDRGEVTVFFYKDILVPAGKKETVAKQQWSLINMNLNMAFPYGLQTSSNEQIEDIYQYMDQEYHE